MDLENGSSGDPFCLLTFFLSAVHLMELSVIQGLKQYCDSLLYSCFIELDPQLPSLVLGVADHKAQDINNLNYISILNTRLLNI